MPYVAEDIEYDLIDSYDWFTRSEGRLIGRVPVGKFIEEEINNERRIFIEVYKLPDGYRLWHEWDFVSQYAATPQQAQDIIEQMQDTWIELAGEFMPFS